jgi:hypothetical protein
MTRAGGHGRRTCHQPLAMAGDGLNSDGGRWAWACDELDGYDAMDGQGWRGGCATLTLPSLSHPLLSLRGARQAVDRVDVWGQMLPAGPAGLTRRWTVWAGSGPCGRGGADPRHRRGRRDPARPLGAPAGRPRPHVLRARARPAAPGPPGSARSARQRQRVGRARARPAAPGPAARQQRTGGCCSPVVLLGCGAVCLGLNSSGRLRAVQRAIYQACGATWCNAAHSSAGRLRSPTMREASRYLEAARPRARGHLLACGAAPLGARGHSRSELG